MQSFVIDLIQRSRVGEHAAESGAIRIEGMGSLNAEWACSRARLVEVVVGKTHSFIPLFCPPTAALKKKPLWFIDLHVSSSIIKSLFVRLLQGFNAGATSPAHIPYYDVTGTRSPRTSQTLQFHLMNLLRSPGFVDRSAACFPEVYHWRLSSHPLMDVQSQRRTGDER